MGLLPTKKYLAEGLTTFKKSKRLENTLLYPKQEYQANLYGCKLLLGEKGECYETEVKAAASCRSLREMAGIIAAPALAPS